MTKRERQLRDYLREAKAEQNPADVRREHLEPEEPIKLPATEQREPWDDEAEPDTDVVLADEDDEPCNGCIDGNLSGADQ